MHYLKNRRIKNSPATGITQINWVEKTLTLNKYFGLSPSASHSFNVGYMYGIGHPVGMHNCICMYMYIYYSVLWTYQLHVSSLNSNKHSNRNSQKDISKPKFGALSNSNNRFFKDFYRKCGIFQLSKLETCVFPK
jgi:hypothetical protein